MKEQVDVVVADETPKATSRPKEAIHSLCLQCVCLRECIKEMSKPTMNFEYFNALFTMVKNTWAKKIKTSIWNHHCGIKAAYTNQI